MPVLGLVKGALRAEWARPNERRFATLAEAQASLDAWVEEYNTVRPHQSLGGLVLDGRTIRLGDTWRRAELGVLGAAGAPGSLAANARRAGTRRGKPGRNGCCGLRPVTGGRF